MLGRLFQTGTRHPPKTRLRVERLESRDVPTWFYVQLADGAGTHGESLGNVIAGELGIDPQLEPDEYGGAYIEAADEWEAIRNALLGSVTVDLSAVGLPTTTYSFSPATAGLSATEHTAFVVGSSPTGGTVYRISLEDLAAYPAQSDWDYNDHYWDVEVVILELPPPPPTGSGVVSGVVWDDAPHPNDVQDVDETGRADYYVALYGGDGQFLRSTYTDTSGNYSFAGLVDGDYKVRFDGGILGPLEQFVAKGAGAGGSDANADGWTDPFVLAAPPGGPNPGPQPDQVVKRGGTRPVTTPIIPPPPSPPSPQVMLVTPYMFVNSAELKVAKWAEAFESIPNVLKGGRLKKKDANGLDFIDHDPDRFNVMVYDANKWATQTPTVTASVKTTNDAGYADYNDDDTEVKLVRLTNYTGWYMSDSMILVSNDADDDLDKNTILKGYTPAQGQTIPSLGTDDAGPLPTTFNVKGGYNFYLGDRTHKIALGGSAWATYNPAYSIHSSVNVKQTVRLWINNLMIPLPPGVYGPPAPAVTDPSIDNDLKRMREIYAQVGIKVEEAHRGTPYQPGIVDLSNGLAEYPNSPPVGGHTWINPTGEEKALLDGLHSTPPAPNAPGSRGYYIDVYYVNTLSNQSIGESFVRNWLHPANQKYSHSVVMRAIRPYDTLAHEVGHVLENVPNTVGPHYPYTVAWENRYSVNLMVNGVKSIENDMTDPRNVTDSRRLTEGQQGRMRSGGT